jgi:hypothetical protein
MKGKRCPSCGTFNQISSIICAGCKEDLLRVPISEGELSALAEEPVKKEEPAENEKDASAPAFCRRCPKCGKVSPYRVKSCDCGTLLITQPPFEPKDEDSAEETKEENPGKETEFVLVSEDGRFTLPLTMGEDYILGRKATGAEYLSTKSYVSGRHLSVKVTEEGIVLEHVGSTNPTMVNGKELRPNTPYRISVNDKISLGAREGQEIVSEAAYFRLMKKTDD